MFVAPKVKYCLSINENGVTEKKTFKVFQDAKRLLDRKKFFDLLQGETIS